LSTEQSTTAQAPLATSSSSAGESAPAGHKALTAKQQQVYDLTRPVSEGGQGKTRAEAAAILGISAPVVSKTLQACYKKLGLKRVRGEMQTTEVKRPEVVAAVMDCATNPDVELKLGKLREAYREAGLPIGAAEALIKRLRVKFFGAITATRNLKTQEILDLLGQKIHLALQYMDDKVMGEASFRDLALGTTAMIEKRQLLRGEPTQIISDAERAKLHELLPMAIAEAKRRGLTVEGEVVGRTVEPA
jgi:DNA-binding CsgD family transcriptional regulator